MSCNPSNTLDDYQNRYSVQAQSVGLRERIPVLAEAFDGNVTALCKAAQLSTKTLYAAAKRERLGKSLNLTDATVERLARVSGKTPAYIRGLEDDAASAAARKLVMRQVVEDLRELDKIAEGEAWEALVDLAPGEPTYRAYYRAARAALAVARESSAAIGFGSGSSAVPGRLSEPEQHVAPRPPGRRRSPRR